MAMRELAASAVGFEGMLQIEADWRFGIVASRTSSFVVERLVDGARDALRRHGALDGQVTVVRTPGSFEIPLVARRLASAKAVDAVVALGAVIRGATPHFEYVASETSKGCAAVMLETGVPVAFGILTTDTIEQAIERAGSKGGNKGWDAAMAAIEMVSLCRKLAAAGI